MSKQIRVGLLTASISPRAGGLFWALPPLARGVSRAGCDISVFAVDTVDDVVASQWGVPLSVHTRRGPRAFNYAPQLSTALDAAGLDLVHTHGLWTYPSAVAARWTARWRRPLVVSPHGMLDPWAVDNSAWKKRVAGWMFENRQLNGAACLHALNAAERAAIRAYGLTNPIAVIPNGIDLPNDLDLAPPEWAAGLDPDARIMLFLGRLHPKKNLASLLHAWAEVQRVAGPDAAAWRLIVAGWDEGGYQAKLQSTAERLGLGDNVRFVGPQFEVQKAASLAYADAFVLPSVSEGLPMAILEAWAHSLPVLMTRECNLPEGLAVGAAMEIETEVGPMAEALAVFLTLPGRELRAMGVRGRLLVQERFAWDAVAQRMAMVYLWLVTGGAAPEWVFFE